MKGALGPIAVALALWAPAGAAARSGVRYHHARHAASAKKDIPCNDCHRLSEKTGWLQSKPVAKAGDIHQPCADAGCHEQAYLNPKKPKNASFCFGCHVGKLGKKLVYPPYRERGPSDFFLAKFSHEVHIRAAKDSCGRCHAEAPDGAARDMTRAGHESCATADCHGEKVKPLMAACTACHAERRLDDGVGPAKSLEPDAYRVRAAFLHLEHGKKSRDDACEKCHTNVRTASGEAPPLPPMAACEKCHDGEGAFRAVGTTCQKCHVSREMEIPPTRTSSVPRFEHVLHATSVGVSIKECEGCHVGTKTNGRLKFPGQQHKPCSNDACHAAEFRKRGSTFCFVCHMKNDPFGKNATRPTLQVPQNGTTEFDVPFSHKEHLARKALAAGMGGGPCGRCHAREMGQDPPEAPLGTLAPDHLLCASCHEAVAAPKMLDCGGCHHLAGVRSGSGEPPASVWRVRTKFSHTSHRFDARLGPAAQRPLPCTECHGSLASAGAGQPAVHPTMAGCASSCHDGKIAFKTTGFGCTKCHGEAT